MSLINDALKKAQNQRGSGTAPHATPPTGAPAPSPAPSAPKAPAWLMVAGGLVGGLALAAIVFVAVRPAPPAPGDSERAEPPVTALAVTTAAAPTTVTPPTGTSALPPPTVASPANSAGANDVSAREDDAVLTVSTREPPAPPASDTTATTVSSALPSPTDAAPPAESRPTTRMINAIEALRVTGIRASGSDSKVLMNDRVYRIGDTVDHELRIKLTGATANSLTFTDETGTTYTRNFY